MKIGRCRVELQCDIWAVLINFIFIMAKMKSNNDILKMRNSH